MTSVVAKPLFDLDAMPSPMWAKTLALIDLLAKHPAGLSATRRSRKAEDGARLRHWDESVTRLRCT
jgi:hypothetical protein